VRKAMVDCNYVIADPNLRLQDALLSEAAKSYCMIIMGTHSKRNALVRTFLGSSARDTILQAEIPVVIVHCHH
jgi:nucleotide-binding universal stress UspA family protein